MLFWTTCVIHVLTMASDQYSDDVFSIYRGRVFRTIMWVPKWNPKQQESCCHPSWFLGIVFSIFTQSDGYCSIPVVIEASSSTTRSHDGGHVHNLDHIWKNLSQHNKYRNREQFEESIPFIPCGHIDVHDDHSLKCLMLHHVRSG